ALTATWPSTGSSVTLRPQQMLRLANPSIRRVLSPSKHVRPQENSASVYYEPVPRPIRTNCLVVRDPYCVNPWICTKLEVAFIRAIMLAERIPVRAKDFSQSCEDGPRMLP